MSAGVSYYIGVDPGVSGGIAIIDNLGLVVRAFKMPETATDILEALHAVNPAQARAMLERVNPGVFGHGKQGQRMGVVSAFTFGRGVGRLEAVLELSGVPFDLIAPASWQAALGCRSGGNKNVTKARAQQLFSGSAVKVTHAIADALLLAEYCRRCYLRVGHPQEGAEHGEAVEGAGGEEGQAGEEGPGERFDREAGRRRLEGWQAGQSSEAAAGGAPRSRAGAKRAPGRSV